MTLYRYFSTLLALRSPRASVMFCLCTTNLLLLRPIEVVHLYALVAVRFRVSAPARPCDHMPQRSLAYAPSRSRPSAAIRFFDFTLLRSRSSVPQLLCAFVPLCLGALAPFATLRLWVFRLFVFSPYYLWIFAPSCSRNFKA